MVLPSVFAGFFSRPKVCIGKELPGRTDRDGRFDVWDCDGRRRISSDGDQKCVTTPYGTACDRKSSRCNRENLEIETVQPIVQLPPDGTLMDESHSLVDDWDAVHHRGGHRHDVHRPALCAGSRSLGGVRLYISQTTCVLQASRICKD
ncbi:hypothetical protein RvY_17348-1 [Ramazzottius varieornatus]|uniref:Uncharacterized protein n=1 Tax=Ramazzottius varieornatus TaxID=947166 RepID=A0A1D1W419_RAMVA|nr:hypothetical protein RvY_17348-1 [Ramazzottius varieornatus]